MKAGRGGIALPDVQPVPSLRAGQLPEVRGPRGIIIAGNLAQRETLCPCEDRLPRQFIPVLPALGELEGHEPWPREGQMKSLATASQLALEGCFRAHLAGGKQE